MAAPSPRNTTSTMIAGFMPVIIILAMIAYAVAVYLLLFLPKINELVAGGDLDLDAGRQALADEQAYASRLKTTLDAYTALDANAKEKLTQMIPSEPDVPGLFVQMDVLAKNHGMVLVSMDTAPNDQNKNAQGLRSTGMSVNVAGAAMPQFLVFLQDVERAERLLDLQSLIFTPKAASYSMTLTAYSLDPETAYASSLTRVAK